MSNTSNLDLERPDKGDAEWHTSLNSNMLKLDTGYGNNVSTIADLPQMYIETGTFNYTTGDVITLPVTVDATNEYGVEITPTSWGSAIGDIYVTKTTSQFTVHCSSDNTADTFEAVIYYIGDIASYGGSIYRRWYVSPDAGIADHGDDTETGSLAWVLDQIGATLATVELPGNKTYTITTATVVPENVNVIPQKGAVFDGAGTLTFDNASQIDASQNQQIFGSSITVVFTNSGTVYPEWWGVDGTADQVQFIAADTSLSSGGKILAFGAYIFSATYTISSNITVLGIGKSSSITTIGDIYALTISGGAVYPNDSRGIIVSDLALYGPNTSIAGGGVYMQNCHECIIRNNTISDTNKGLFYGIHLDGALNNDADNNIIANNVFAQTLDTSIYLYTNALPAAVEENVIQGNVITGAGRNGISLVGNRNTIIGNTVEESGWHGIVISACSWNTITGNTSCESVRSGISLESLAVHNTVTGNVVKDNDVNNTAIYNGIQCVNGDRNTIIGNICIENDNYEIYLDTNSSNNIVLGNTVYGTDHENTIVDSGTRNQVSHNLKGLQDISAHHFKITSPAGTLTINGGATTGLTTVAMTDWDLDTDLTVPSNAIGVLFEVAIQDSGAAGTDCFFKLQQKGGDQEYTIRCMPANDRWNHANMIVEFDTNKNLQYQVLASGAGTLDAVIKLIGWILE